MLRYALLIKLLVLGGLIIIMIIPMAMIMGTIKERVYYQEDVIDSVAKSSSYAQTIVGPIIVIPYTETLVEFKKDQKFYIERKYVRYVLPQQSDIKATADISPRHIGIYQAQVYQSELNLTGLFDPVSIESLKNNESIEIKDPYLIVLISDTRGIMQVPLMTINGQKINFEPGIKDSGISGAEGINAPLSLDQLTSGKLNFNFSLLLQGTKELSIVPIGRSSNYSLTGNWPHPNFVGYTLPIHREINDDGFKASWQSSWYANNINSIFAKDVDVINGYGICSNGFSGCFPSFKASFVETVDQYQMTERAVKYDILFIALTFICFFIFEMLKQFKIHPVQYLLVGMALTIFYLLLLALSEHIGFTFAYMCGALACSLLIGFYLTSALKSLKWGGIFTSFLLMLYTVLYFVMISEGNALLLGSLLLFIILGGIMILTRKVDWYIVTQFNDVKKGNKHESVQLGVNDIKNSSSENKGFENH